MKIQETKNKTHKKLKKTIKVILLAIIIILLLLIIYNFINTKILKKGYTSILGISCFEVTSGSMMPAIKVNDIVIIKKEKSYKKNDIITFKDEKNFVTHRIKNIKGSNFITQGDTNNNLDKIVPEKNIIGKKILIIPQGGLLKKTILTPKVLLLLLLTLFIISIAYSYKRFVRKGLKKPIKGLNPKIFLTRKSIIKNIDKNRFKEISKLNILIITIVLLIGLIPITISRYDSTAVGTTTTNIAYYLLKPTYMNNNIKMATLSPSNVPYVYTFSISNYTENDTSEVDLEYVLQIITTTNLPLTYKLYMNEDYTSNTATNLVTNNNTTVTADDDGTYFKYITLAKEELYYNTPKINNYTLLIYYLPESANAIYQNTIESVRIVIDSNQIVSN